MRLRFRARRSRGCLTERTTRHHLADLARRLRVRRLDPRELVVRRRNARQLAGRREAELTIGERLVQMRQLFEPLGHAQTFLRLAPHEPEQSLGVFVEAAEAPELVHAEQVAAAHQDTELAVFACTPRRERAQLAIDLTRFVPPPGGDLIEIECVGHDHSSMSYPANNASTQL